MENAKIEVAIGQVSFKGEGREDWLEKQLDKVLSMVPEIGEQSDQDICICVTDAEESEDNEVQAEPVESQDEAAGDSSSDAKEENELEAFLKSKNAGESQVDKFLATAVWLTLKGDKILKTSSVTKALKENNQKSLGNASACLSRNVEKGYCKKKGREFLVTEEGMKAL